MLMVSVCLFGQQPEGATYGIDLSQVHTGSGHGSSFAMNTDIQQGRRSIEFGVLYQEDQKRISGGNVEYKVFLGRNAFRNNHAENHGLTFKPYIHYNCIYHNFKVNTPDFVPVGAKKASTADLSTSPGLISTMEHYAGLGLQVMISSNVSFDSSMGLGAYIGSLDKVTAPETIGIHGDNFGFVLAVQFGLGYKFGI